jgi:hypothetical protein
MEHSYRSQEINSIALSLSIAQGMFKPLKESQRGPRGMYSNLNDIHNATREALSKNHIALLHNTFLLDAGTGASLLWTELVHESGQYIKSCRRYVEEKTMRVTGNILEIIKRQEVLNLLGVAPSSTDPYLFDDDGETEADNYVVKELKKPIGEQKLDTGETISDGQFQNLMVELQGQTALTKNIHESYGIKTIADLPKSEYFITLEKIRRLKKRAEDYDKRSQ